MTAEFGAPPAFLGVERSLTGRRWQMRPGDARLAATLSQRFALPEVIGRVLAARGIGLDEAPDFLAPTLKALLPDPSHLKDMDRAAERVARAVMAGEPIGIFGDYDVDGATSSALLATALGAAGGRSEIHIPDRLAEGYGPNLPALLALKAKGCGVVVTVDCGTTAFDPLEAAAAAGLDVVVVDHHEAEAGLPRAYAVVNPNRLDEDSPHGHLAAVGVAFLLAVAVCRSLRQAGWFAGRPEPDLKRVLDLVALGTVCDVVPLAGVNRALVTQGLKVMARRGNVGLAALADVAGVREAPDAYHLGYVLGPRVNAGGRVGEAALGSRLLCCEDPAAAADMARRLDGYNKERQEIEAAVLLEAIEQVESRPDDGLPLVLAAGEGWHPGVIGIVAGRLKERYGRPACVVAFDGETGKGSGRSITGLDLRRYHRRPPDRHPGRRRRPRHGRRLHRAPRSAGRIPRIPGPTPGRPIGGRLGTAPGAGRGIGLRRRHGRSGGDPAPASPLRRRQRRAALRRHRRPHRQGRRGRLGPCPLRADRRRRRPPQGHRLPRRRQRTGPRPAGLGRRQLPLGRHPARRHLERHDHRPTHHRRRRPGPLNRSFATIT